MPIFGFAGFSGSGKTTLLEKLIPLFVTKGLKIALIKHAHHDFDADLPGKDSHRHRAAGVTEVLVTSARRWAVVHELRDEPEPGLEQHVARLAPCDLVLVEGFKREVIPKLEVHRLATGKSLLFPQDPYIVAVAADTPLPTNLPQMDINQPQTVADFILCYLEIA
uniref:Molybdopterin-guanine dinucleotide biosynthesis protein B n=1 Tax=mine drainage metagenome TaxID=410659 RepID=E6QQA5_9ZZZZ